MVWTDLRVLKPDGSRFHGVGIRPTIPLSRTRAGVARGVDEILARGIAMLKGSGTGTPPAITSSGIVNGASFQPGPVAPGELVSIFGTDLGPSEGVLGYYDEMGYLTRYLGGTRVFFDQIQAPLTYVSSKQVNAVVPYGVAANAVVTVEHDLAISKPVAVSVAQAAPGIFATSSSQAVVVNQNGSLNSDTNPAARGEIVTLFATGEGATSPAGVDGRLPAAGKWPTPAGDLSVLFGGKPGTIQFKAQVYAGVLQVNVRVPADAPVGGSVPLALLVSGSSSGDKVRMAIQ